jgi:hypothetical protein
VYKGLNIASAKVTPEEAQVTLALPLFPFNLSDRGWGEKIFAEGKEVR